ncbi:Alpha,alpha-trehalose phosphate synthase subunit, putative [Penicillium digitatum]|uniref:Alpha,alpha-trehalose phosphate synthase subunit, putative n=1 Tax=Penicillium digitatum TaxID=36651 RepID=A0A7T6XI40_PENDI|nr:Alpha,alpha-trehalose phosphate synthase subunit, putative [Penicillium digitatum]
MTVFIASLFLPYTIDFQVTEPKHGQHGSISSYANVDGPGSIVGRLSDHRLMDCLPLTPGVTTEDEMVLRGYTWQVEDEIPIANDRLWHGPSEPRTIHWGHSRRFNQPPSQATDPPTPSILSSRSPAQGPKKEWYLDGSQDQLSMKYQGSTRVSLSDTDWVVKAAEQGHGGLQNAIHAAERSSLLKDRIWVGTLGMPTDSLTDLTRTDIAVTLQDAYDSLTVFVSDNEFDGHYTHFCRTVLWPALHYQMQESPRHTEYNGYSWVQYLKLNKAFAETIIKHWKPGDRIWVHDYHLLVLPGLLRERLPQAEIGLFLHTPFPSSEIFRCLNPREELLDGLLGADLIGFQTEEYCNHFLHSCSRLRRLEISANQVHLNDRYISVVNSPMGIDPMSLYILRQSTEVKGWIRSIGHKYQGKHLMVARDRLDAPGGIKQKLLAYELFLKTYPEWRERVVLVQVMSSASETPELEVQISKIAMRINATYSTITHQPLVLVRQDISHFQFIALLSVAHVFMATNLREETWIPNPQRCADAIKSALEMSPTERKFNWNFLLNCKSPYTALKWHTGLQDALTKAHEIQQIRQTNNLSRLSPDDLRKAYLAARARMFFLEDSAIFGPAFGMEESIPSIEACETLQTLANDPKNILYMISNRSIEQLQEALKKLPYRLGFIVENGCFLRNPESAQWIPFVPESSMKWCAGIKKIMEHFHERTEGSRIEERRCSLTFHYDGALDREVAACHASELAYQINGDRGRADFHVVREATSVKFEPPHAAFGNGRAATYILDHLPNARYPEFLFAAGGSRSGDTLFRWANELAVAPVASRVSKSELGKTLHVTTVTTSTHATEARSVVPSDCSLLDVLDELSNFTSREEGTK